MSTPCASLVASALPLRALANDDTRRLAAGLAVGLLAAGIGARLLAAAPSVLWTEVLVQGVIAGAGTLLTYAKMVSLLGPSRAAIFPALAPGLLVAVTASSQSPSPSLSRR
jgi:hypothetical protein